MSERIRQMIRNSHGTTTTRSPEGAEQATLAPAERLATSRGAGGESGHRPGRLPSKGHVPEEREASPGSQPPQEHDRARVVGLIPLPQRVVQRRSPNHRRRSSASATEVRPTCNEVTENNSRGVGVRPPKNLD